jgi:hypothetical protein
MFMLEETLERSAAATCRPSIEKPNQRAWARVRTRACREWAASTCRPRSTCVALCVKAVGAVDNGHQYANLGAAVQHRVRTDLRAAATAARTLRFTKASNWWLCVLRCSLVNGSGKETSPWRRGWCRSNRDCAPCQRQVLDLRYIETWNNSEIAEGFGCNLVFLNSGYSGFRVTQCWWKKPPSWLTYRCRGL